MVKPYRVWVWKDGDQDRASFDKPPEHIVSTEYIMAPNEIDPSGLSLRQLIAGKQSLYSCSEDPEFDDVRKVFAAIMGQKAIPLHADECAYVERGEECDCGLWASKSAATELSGSQEHRFTVSSPREMRLADIVQYNLPGCEWCFGGLSDSASTSGPKP
jgi:hypothetical protein